MKYMMMVVVIGKIKVNECVCCGGVKGKRRWNGNQQAQGRCCLLSMKTREMWKKPVGKKEVGKWERSRQLSSSEVSKKRQDYFAGAREELGGGNYDL